MLCHMLTHVAISSIVQAALHGLGMIIGFGQVSMCLTRQEEKGDIGYIKKLTKIF